jgi:myo-inositol catabolism protein IolC
MELGYDGQLFILAFDHRGSFQKKFFGIEGEPDAEQTKVISDAKHLIFEGLLAAVDQGAEVSTTGVLIDEQFGSTVPQEARAKGLKLAMPVERSGQKVFDFEYGERFGEHIETFAPDFAKVLVRYNPEGDREANRLQLERLKRLSDWLRDPARSSLAVKPRFLFELLVPAEEHQLAKVGGDADRYDAELRPALMRQAIAEIQDAGIEVDVWKIEGLERREDCEAVVAQARAGGRDRVACVVLGRGADSARVEHWLREAAPVEGFCGFAIGRSIWWDPLKAFTEGSLGREQAAQQIAANYLRFRSVYEQAGAAAALT